MNIELPKHIVSKLKAAKDKSKKREGKEKHRNNLIKQRDDARRESERLHQQIVSLDAELATESPVSIEDLKTELLEDIINKI